jgi:GNAT superfamily N-acetyltransferase
MPWIKRYAFEPSGFKIIPWSEIKDNSFLLIRNHVLESPDFPGELDPFRELDLIEKKTSLVLFTKEGDLAGWSLAHRIKKDTVRYSGIYVKKEYQGAGIAVILLMNSISRQVLTQMLDFVPYGIFAVYKRTPMMLKMCRKRFTPYADSVSESVSRFKTINCRP